MKRYACSFPGCGKSFSRSGHLVRHSQNHTDLAWICDRCTACFKREDLLERHKTRHAIKDKEAGGIGILETKRKHRLRVATAQRNSAHRVSTEQLQLPDSDPSQQQQESPSHVENATATDSAPISHPNIEDENPAPSHLRVSRSSAIANYQSPTGMLSPPSPSHSAESRRIEAPPSIDGAQTDNSVSVNAPEYDTTDIAQFMMEFSAPFMPGTQDMQTAPFSDLTSNDDLEDFVRALAELDQQQHHFPSDNSWLNQNSMAEPPQVNMSGLEFGNGIPSDGSISTINNMNGVTTTAAADWNYAPPAISSNDVPTTTAEKSSVPKEPQPSSAKPSENLPPTAPPPTPARSPQVLILTDQDRDDVFELISEIKPLTPEGATIDLQTPRFAIDKMQRYLNKFLEFFNVSYPLIHIPTFDVHSVDRVLLLSMMLVGATYHSKHAHQESVCIYNALIPHVFAQLSGNVSMELSRLQALLVLECYGMYRAGPSQRETALLLHGLLLSSIRKISRYQVRATLNMPDNLQDVGQDWMSFAHAEQYRRLVLFFFMWDVENACFFSVVPSVSVLEIDMALPCSAELWVAARESEWKTLASRPRGSQRLLPLVLSYLSSDDQSPSPEDDKLGLTLVLHGIISICNDRLRACDLATILGAASNDSWRQQMSDALEAWKARYDAFAMTIILNMNSEPLHCEFQRDSMAIFALYHTAHIAVNLELRHLQIAAGANTIFGHVVQPHDQKCSKEWMMLRAHGSAESMGRAAWHAAQMFRQGMLNLTAWYVHDVFHYPWCLYLATLTCWATSHFGAAVAAAAKGTVDGQPQANTTPNDKEENSRIEMNHLVSTLASATPANMARVVRKCRTRGLTREMAKYLRGVRWTAAYEGVVVLEGLANAG